MPRVHNCDVAGAPKLAGDALSAVQHRGTHLQIIASAGSGKTEVVAQRVADILADGGDPEGVIAFTFTERAAASLAGRISQRVAERCGQDFTDRLNGMFVGTIHAYCFRLLQEYLSEYETYDMLDEHRLAAFLTRESFRLGLKQLDGTLYKSIKAFTKNLDVVENELLEPGDLEEPFRSVLAAFYERLDTFRFLTYGRLIGIAVAELRNSATREAACGKVRHLIVDEYQDVNPAQEELIRLIAVPPVELCVVGDDDQSIYQWRGSDVSNIVQFKERYAARPFSIAVNRRSRPEIIRRANTISAGIPGRLPKEMLEFREPADTEVVAWRAPTEAEEASVIASTIGRIHERGYAYREMAILVRSSTCYPALLAALRDAGVPVMPGGRTGLFGDSHADLFGRTFAFLGGIGWRRGYGQASADDAATLAKGYTLLFDLSKSAGRAVQERLEGWREEAEAGTRAADLITEYYGLLAACGIKQWDLSDPGTASRLGILARCSAILADYESVRRRSRPDEDAPGEVIGGIDRGQRYYFWLASHIQNWAQSAYEGFEGEDDDDLDAVDLTTIHKAKGLEWRIVFVPSLSAKRFPSQYTGKPQDWLVPRSAFPAERYEGSTDDERRLFYVAITRARDWLSVSTHDTPNKQHVDPSPFLLAFHGGKPDHATELPLPDRARSSDGADDDVIGVTYSDLAMFKECGLAFRYRRLLGFEAPLNQALGFGRSVHHIMRRIAEEARSLGRVPTAEEIDALLDGSFVLPYASKPTHLQAKAAARRLVGSYTKKYGDDLFKVWAAERPFELHLPGAVVSGRADVILDENAGGDRPALAIVDYKTSADEADHFDLQLQVYADAGRREGLDVTAAYVHDLDKGERIPVDVSDGAVGHAEASVTQLLGRLRARDFSASPERARCTRCDVKEICPQRAGERRRS